MSVYKRFKGKKILPGSKDYDRGTWYVSKRIGGRLINKPIPEAKTKAQAEKAEIKMLADRLDRRLGLVIDIGFQKFADENYLKYTETHNENSYVQELFVKEFKKFFGSKNMADISPEDCQNYQYQRLHTPIKGKARRSSASVNRELSALKRLFTLACEQGYLRESPAKYLRKLKESPPRRRSLNDDQKKALWKELEADVLVFRLVTLGLNLPLRRGQILAIEPEKVDLTNRTLLAKGSKRRPERIVPLNDTAAVTLAAMIEDGQLPLPLQRFEKRWHQILINAKINKPDGTREENFHFHDLRHLFGTELLRRGVNVYHIKELFAHSDIKTSAIYITAQSDQLAAAVRTLDVQELDGVN
jgi:integrase